MKKSIVAIILATCSMNATANWSFNGAFDKDWVVAESSSETMAYVNDTTKQANITYSSNNYYGTHDIYMFDQVCANFNPNEYIEVWDAYNTESIIMTVNGQKMSGMMECVAPNTMHYWPRSDEGREYMFTTVMMSDEISIKFDHLPSQVFEFKSAYEDRRSAHEYVQSKVENIL